jgi:hypothetical protein
MKRTSKSRYYIKKGQVGGNPELDAICKKDGFPIIEYILPKKNRIIAIGDLHGDWEVMKKCLIISKIIDDDDNWIAEPNTVVIQVGDQLDGKRQLDIEQVKNPDDIYDISIMLYLNDLHQKAQEKDKNSGVYGLLGNHEIMNVDDPYNASLYMNIRDTHVFNSINNLTKRLKYEPIEGSKMNRINCFKPGNPCARLLACTRHVIMKIGNNLFVHGGLVNDFVKKYNIHQANDSVKGWLLGKIDEEIKYDIIRGSTNLTYALSPFWTRLYDLPEHDKDMCKMVDNIRGIYEFDNMIIGHSVQLDGINNICNNKIWRIDIGLSKCFEGIPNKQIQILEIINDNEFHILT